MVQYSREKYINPFTDYGFKRLFGEEVNKDLLLDFLNELLKEEQGLIQEIQYIRNEYLGTTDFDRKAIFDLYCQNEKGERFIVELQKAKQEFFKDRSIYYSTFAIAEQAKRGKWNFEQQKVYTIALLDFKLDDIEKGVEKYRHDIKLMDVHTCKVFYDKLTFIYLEMPKFQKELHELESKFEKWMYLLCNLPYLDNRPPELQERIFQKLFASAEIARFSRTQLRSYEQSLKQYRDMDNALDTAKAEGMNDQAVKTVERCYKKGFEATVAAELANLPLSEVNKIYKDLNQYE